MKIITFLIVAFVILISGTGFVLAQSFAEPTTTPNLPPPLATTDKSQAIQGTLQVGVSAFSTTVSNVALYVQGGLITKPGYQNGSTRDANVTISSATNVFKVNGSSTQVLFGAATCSQGNVQACAQSTTGAAVYAMNPTGVALFGETAGSNAAGVYGESPNFGIWGIAETIDAIPLQVRSCTTVAGDSSTCSSYGQAGSFVGDVKIEGSVGSETGYWTGDGNRLYRVQSLYNKQEGSTPTSSGVAYLSIGYPNSVTVNSISGATIVLPVAAQQVVSIFAVESSDNTNFVPAGNDLRISYTESSATFSVTNNAGAIRQLRMIVGYLQ